MRVLILGLICTLYVWGQNPDPVMSVGGGGGSGGGGSVTINAPASGNEVVKNGTGSSFNQRNIAGGTGIICTQGTDTITCTIDSAVVPLWSAGSGAPSANCTAGAAYYLDTTAQSIYFCSATNTWKLVSNTVFALADTGGDDTYGNSTACSGFPATYASGQTVILQATTANTGAATLDCGPGAKAIKLVDGSTDPANGNITSKQPAILQYDSSADGGSGAWLLLVSGSGGSSSPLLISNVNDNTRTSSGDFTSSGTITSASINSAGKIIKFRVAGYVNLGAAGQPTLSLKFGSTTVIPSTTLNYSSTTAVNHHFVFEGSVTVRTAGASGATWGSAFVIASDNTAAQNNYPGINGNAASTVTLDTTASHNFIVAVGSLPGSSTIVIKAVEVYGY